MEPTRQMVCARMSLRRAAHSDRQPVEENWSRAEEYWSRRQGFARRARRWRRLSFFFRDPRGTQDVLHRLIPSGVSFIDAKSDSTCELAGNDPQRSV